MTVLAKTSEYLVEFEGHHLTIARREDGHCLLMSTRRIRGDFLHLQKRLGSELAIEKMIVIATAMGHLWQPLYKARAMPDLLAP